MDPRAFQSRLRGGADAPNQAHWFVMQKIRGFRRADDRKALGFVEVRGDFGEELVMAEAYRACDAKLVRNG